jgi:hypothetical protein
MRAEVANLFERGGQPAKETITHPLRNINLRAFLLDILADGPVPMNIVIERGAARGFTKKQICHAREQMKIIALKETKKRYGRWLWALVPPTRAVYQAPPESATGTAEGA